MFIINSTKAETSIIKVFATSLKDQLFHFATSIDCHMEPVVRSSAQRGLGAFFIDIGGKFNGVAHLVPFWYLLHGLKAVLMIEIES